MKGGVFYYTQISHIGGGEGRVTKKVVGRTFLSTIQLVVVQGFSKRSASREDERSLHGFYSGILGSLLWQSSRKFGVNNRPTD